MEKKISVQDLSENLSSRNEMPRKDAELFVRSVFEIIEEYLKTDKIVKIKGLGTFKLVSMDSRESVDVNTGERILINGYVKVSFTPDPVLRDEINKPFSQFETVTLCENTDLSEFDKLDHQSESELIGSDSVLEEADMSSEDNTDESENSEVVENNVISSGQTVIDAEDTEALENVSVNEVDQTAEQIQDVEPESNNTSEAAQRYVAERMSDHVSAIETPDLPSSEKESVESTVTTSSVVETKDNSAESSNINKNDSDEQVSQPDSDNSENIGVETNANGFSETSVNQGVKQNQDAEASQSSSGNMNIEHLHADYQHVGEQHAEEIEVDHQRVKTQTAGSQHVDMQNVEHQTIENQHIVQMTNGQQVRKKFMPPVWVIVLSLLIVLLLMLGSYFVGYYRLLCPSGCETVSYVSRAEVVRDLPVIKPQDSVKVEQPADTVKTEVAQSEKDEAMKSVQTKEVQKNVSSDRKADAVSQKTTTTTVSKQTAKSGPQKNTATKYPQLKGGKYEIIGTLATVRLKSGETLRNLALKYYGSKNYVPYIVVYNRIENPDIIAENSEIKLPDLRRKEE